MSICYVGQILWDIPWAVLALASFTPLGSIVPLLIFLSFIIAELQLGRVVDLLVCPCLTDSTVQRGSTMDMWNAFAPLPSSTIIHSHTRYEGDLKQCMLLISPSPTWINLMSPLPYSQHYWIHETQWNVMPTLFLHVLANSRYIRIDEFKRNSNPWGWLPCGGGGVMLNWLLLPNKVFFAITVEK